MKNNFFKMFGFLLAIILFVPANMAFAATSTTGTVKSLPYQIVVDGRNLELPSKQYVFTFNNTSYVPIRFISYALLQTVKWDQKSSTVAVSKPTDKELVPLREYLLNSITADGQPASQGNVSLSISPMKASFVFFGEKKQLPVGQTSYMLNNSLYVPIRFMSESTGMDVKWDSSKQRIIITSPVVSAPSKPGSGTSGSGNSSNNGGAAGGTSGVPVSVPGGGAPGGVPVPVAPSYEDIKFKTEAKLQSLYMNAKNTFLKLGQQYLDTNDKTKKEALKQQGQSTLDSMTSQFNSIVAQAQTELSSYGYSTAIIKEYRDKFNEELEAGKELMNDMLKS